MTKFMHPGYYAIRFVTQPDPVYKKFNTETELSEAVNRYTDMGHMVRSVQYIPDPTVIRVNGQPLV